MAIRTEVAYTTGGYTKLRYHECAELFRSRMKSGHGADIAALPPLTTSTQGAGGNSSPQ